MRRHSIEYTHSPTFDREKLLQVKPFGEEGMAESPPAAQVVDLAGRSVEVWNWYQSRISWPPELQIIQKIPEIWKAISFQAFQYPTNSLSIVTSGGKKTAQVKD